MRHLQRTFAYVAPDISGEKKIVPVFESRFIQWVIRLLRSDFYVSGGYFIASMIVGFKRVRRRFDYVLVSEQ